MDINLEIQMLKGEKGGQGDAVWGNIDGVLENQEDLKDAIDTKVNKKDLAPVCYSNSYEDLSNKPNFSNFATTGSFYDLNIKPNIPSKTSDLVNNSGFIIIDEKEIYDLFYPVGSYFWSTNNTNPGVFLTGTWEQVKDKFILSAGDEFQQGQTGGEKDHTLTENEMISHPHMLADQDSTESAKTNISSESNYTFKQSTANKVRDISDVYTGYTGGDMPHNNMPPYETAFCFKRIS